MAPPKLSPADLPRNSRFDGPCAGCGATLYSATDGYGYKNWVERTLAPGYTVKLCRKDAGTYSKVPKKPCLQRAREKGHRCPGCGQEERHFEPGDLCAECARKIERADAQAARAYTWCVINAKYLMPYLSDTSREEAAGAGLVTRLGRVLARACASEGRFEERAYDVDRYAERVTVVGRSSAMSDSYGEYPAVEVTADQLAAVEELGALIGQVMEAQRAAGRREGQSLLLGLARGEMTTDQYDDRAAKVRKAAP